MKLVGTVLLFYGVSYNSSVNNLTHCQWSSRHCSRISTRKEKRWRLMRRSLQFEHALTCSLRFSWLSMPLTKPHLKNEAACCPLSKNFPHNVKSSSQAVHTWT